jgi:hypothetical protein
MDGKILLCLATMALIAVVVMAGLAEAKEISITKVELKEKGNQIRLIPLLIYLLNTSNRFEVKEFTSDIVVWHGDSGGTSAVITLFANNSIVYAYECTKDWACNEYPTGWATPNAPFTVIRYLAPGARGAYFKLLVSSYGDLNHPYYGVNVTACHYTQPENCASRYVQGKYSGYEIG